MRDRENYIIYNLDTNTVLVILKNYLRLHDILKELEEDFRLMQFNGNVIFDSLLSNGYNSTRFFTTIFNGQKLELKSIKTLAAPLPKIEKKSSVFFKSHTYLLENSVLTQSEILRFTSNI